MGTTTAMHSTAPPAARRRPLTTAADFGLVVLEGIRWDTYLRILDDTGNGRRHLITYDRGRLEIMSPLVRHEIVKKVLARLVEMWAFLRQVRIKSCGSSTWKRADLEMGLEPEECYYVALEHRVRGKMELDLAVDPPPDLAIEVDVTHSSSVKLGVYGALGVPEVWRHDGDRLWILVRDASGAYAPAEAGRAFPELSATVLNGFLERLPAQEEHDLVNAFAEWARTVPDAR